MFASEDDITAIEPDIPLTIALYQCEKTFALNHIEQYIKPKGPSYGWVLTTGGDIRVGVFQGQRQEQWKLHRECGNSKKHKKGGQSAPRFQRIRENTDAAWRKQCSNFATKFLSKELDLRHVFVCGMCELPTSIPHSKSQFGSAHEVKSDLLPRHIEAQNASLVAECYKIMQRQPDSILIGLNEVLSNVHSVKVLYIEEQHADLFLKVPTKHILPNDMLKDLGGCCGVLYFV